MSGIDIESLAWEKQGGLLPAVVQDATTLRVRNGVDDYELMIESVAGGVHDP